MRSIAVLVVLAACEPPISECSDMHSASNTDLGHLPVRSVIRDPDLAQAIDIVFVPEGYDDMIDFHDHVMSLIDDLEHDDGGIVAMAPDLFNYHWVALPGVNLGGCFGEETSRGTWIEADPTRAELAARNAPDVDVVVVVVDVWAGRAHADLRAEHAISEPGFIVIADADDERTLTHELGHALFSLADEYIELDGCSPDHPLADATAVDDFPAIANESFSPGAKWADLVHGAEPGARRYACGVYHPTDDCRMNDEHASAFCPVCAHAIRSELERRRAGANDGPPTCILGTPGPGWFGMTVFDRDAPIQLAVRVDGVTSTFGEQTSPWSSFGTGVTAGPHVIDAECTDRDGLTSRASLSLSF